MTDIFIKVIEMSITASVVIAVIIVLRLLLRKAPKVFSYVLWAAALFRLLCPISFELPAAPVPSIELPYISNASDYSTNGLLMPNTAPDNAAFPEAAVQSEPDAQTQDMTQIQPSPAETAPAKKQINFIIFASYIWAAAVIAMAFRGVISWARLSKALRSAQKAGKNVYVSPAISDPFIMGIIRPKIYLPTGLSYAESELIIRHEKAHMHRGDHIAKLIMYAALCIHCFNPFVWVMFRLFERDMEMSCDEKVTADMTKEQKADYSQTLLKISSRPAAVFTANFGESSVRERVKNVLSFKKPAVWFIIILTIAAAAVSVVLCADRRNADNNYALNDGKYYAVSENTNTYFTVKNGTLQLFGTDSDIMGLFDPLDTKSGSDNRAESEKSKWENPVGYKINKGETEILLKLDHDDSSEITYINENTLEYCGVKFIRREGKKVNISSTSAFGAEAYIIPLIDQYKIDIAVTNMSDDELTVGLTQFFSYCYSSYVINPTLNELPREYTFAPKETKEFIFNVNTSLIGVVEDNKEINGSCVLEITNSDKYDYYNVLEIEPYVIIGYGEADNTHALGMNGITGYMKPEDLNNPDPYEFERHTELVTDESEIEMYRQQFRSEYGDEINGYSFFNEYILIPLYDETGENVVDQFRTTISVTPVAPDNYGLLSALLTDSSGIIPKQLSKSEYIYGNDACELLKSSFDTDFCLPVDKVYSDSALYYGAYEFKPDMNADIFSMSNGTVIFSGYTDELGNTAVIDHGDSGIYLYANINIVMVTENDTVEPGTVIGCSGNSRLLIYKLSADSSEEKPYLTYWF